MSSVQLEILCDGLMVYEVDPICEKLAAMGVRFKVVRVTDEEAGIVNSRKDNWASGLSQVCNYFNHGGLTEHLRILVVAEDLELAKSVIAPAKSRPLLHESRPNLKVLILGVLAVFFGAVAWLATTYWSEPEAQGVCAERQSEGPQRIAVFSGGFGRADGGDDLRLVGRTKSAGITLLYGERRRDEQHRALCAAVPCGGCARGAGEDLGGGAEGRRRPAPEDHEGGHHLVWWRLDGVPRAKAA